MLAPEIEEVTTRAGLEALAPAWHDLWRRASAATPFQSPAWLLPWWRHFGGDDLIVLAVRTLGRLVGVLPLYVYREDRRRKLLPLGIGVSDYCDALLDSAQPHAIACSLLAHLARTTERWDICDLQPLSPTSPLLQAGAPEFSHERFELEPCPVLRLPASAAELEAGLPKRIRQNLRYYRRRAERRGAVRFEVARPENLRELLEAFFALHGARWARRDLPGLLADEAVRTFHTEAAAALMDLGILRLYGLRLGPRVVATLYGFMAKGRFYYYLGGFAPELGDLSLGTLVIGHAMAQATGEGATEFDFLRGREAYKYRWGARDRPSYGIRLTVPTPDQWPDGQGEPWRRPSCLMSSAPD